MSEYISSQLLTTSINVDMKNIKGNINEMLYKLLKNKYEGVCNKDGYIQKGSLQIVNRSIGSVKTINNTSYIVYEITYKANIYSPVKGTNLDITINSIIINNFIKFICEFQLESRCLF